MYGIGYALVAFFTSSENLVPTVKSAKVVTPDGNEESARTCRFLLNHSSTILKAVAIPRFLLSSSERFAVSTAAFVSLRRCLTPVEPLHADFISHPDPFPYVDDLYQYSYYGDHTSVI